MKNKNWQEANQKTGDALASLAYSKDLVNPNWDNMSCPALRQIDQLWADNSKGFYGFSVQSDIYKKTGNPIGDYNEEAYRRFGQEVGWNVDNTWLNYEDLSWGEPKKKGHLPGLELGRNVVGRQGLGRGGLGWVIEGLGYAWYLQYYFIAPRLVNCSI